MNSFRSVITLSDNQNIILTFWAPRGPWLDEYERTLGWITVLQPYKEPANRLTPFPLQPKTDLGASSSSRKSSTCLRVVLKWRPNKRGLQTLNFVGKTDRLRWIQTRRSQISKFRRHYVCGPFDDLLLRISTRLRSNPHGVPKSSSWYFSSCLSYIFSF